MRSASDMLRELLTGLRFAGTAEGEAARRRIRERLPAELRRPDQWLGRVSPGCFATHSVHEGCDFSCTACYLASSANRTPPAPFAEVAAQLDAIRRWAGPGGNVQITSGEVTLLPVDALVAIVRYARAVGLDPMLMTHGQRLARDPAYLHRLMVEGGLAKVSFHVDTTQRGRQGQRPGAREAELNEIREGFAELVRAARAATGRRLHAATTMTVTAENLDEIPDVVRCLVRNADAFRILGLNPTADVGRTRVAAEKRVEQLHARVAEGLGRRINPRTFGFGDPRCNAVALFWVVRFGERVEVVEVTREGRALDRRFFAALTRGAFAGFTLDDATPPEAAGRLLRLFARSPQYAWQWPMYAVARLLGEVRWMPAFAAAVLRGERWFVRPFAVVVHAFMSRDELDTPEGRARLAACSFRVPVGDRMVSMCEVNGTDQRRALNLEARALVQVAEPASHAQSPRRDDRASCGCARSPRTNLTHARGANLGRSSCAGPQGATG